MKSRIVFKSTNDHWKTPHEIYQALDAEFSFRDDPCPFLAVEDGLTRRWKSPAFCNPPYSRIKHWVKKSFDEANLGVIVCLPIPSRTDTIWWHDYIMKASEIRFIKGRLKFGGAKNSAPFPSCIVIFNNKGTL